MPLKTCAEELLAPATLPAVVSTTGAPCCGCAGCDVSARTPAAPLPASSDRLSSALCSACFVITCALGSLRTWPQLRSVLLDHKDPGRSRTAVLHRPPRDRHLVAGLEIVLLDAGAVQGAWTLRFEAPVGGRLVVICDGHPQPGMRVGVLEHFHHALHGDRLGGLEHGARVMGAGGQRYPDHSSDAHEQSGDWEPHMRVPHLRSRGIPDRAASV